MFSVVQDKSKSINNNFINVDSLMHDSSRLMAIVCVKCSIPFNFHHPREAIFILKLSLLRWSLLLVIGYSEVYVFVIFQYECSGKGYDHRLVLQDPAAPASCSSVHQLRLVAWCDMNLSPATTLYATFLLSDILINIFHRGLKKKITLFSKNPPFYNFWRILSPND